MNISKQLKNYRKEFNISQEELGEIIHVSRQTISNWENSKSYPDLQSLLLLSDYFKISLDELVKGDVVIMKRELEVNKMGKYAKYSMVSGLLMILSIAIVKRSVLVGSMLMGIFAALMLWFAFKIEKIKKANDVKTYSEILAYMNHEEIPQIPKEERRKKLIIQSIGLPILFAAISAFLAFIVISL